MAGRASNFERRLGDGCRQLAAGRLDFEPGGIRRICRIGPISLINF